MRQKTTWPGSEYVYYTYDALNRMEFARRDSTTTNEIAYYQYTPLSTRDSLRLAGQNTNRVSYFYELDGDLDLLTNVLSSVSVTLDYGRNGSGQITSINASDDFYLPQPAGVSTDLNGNLLTWFSNGIKQTYTYDSENRLRTVALGAAAPSISYDYDALGRRLSKTVNSATTWYLPDGDEEISEYTTAGVMHRYVMGPAVDDRIAHIDSTSGSAVTRYYHVNHQGSVIATTNADGSIVQRLSYDEYGNLTSAASATGEAFRFTGRRYDEETALYYYRARYYSPVLGRFLQTDPVGYKDDVNLYGYVKNDPLNQTDPLGLSALDDFVYGYTRGALASDGVDVDVPEGVDPKSGAAVAGVILGVGVDQLGQAAVEGSGPRGPRPHIPNAPHIPCACFAAGTSVETDQGARPIETLRPGDVVLARDPETGETAFKPVTEIFVNDEKSIWQLEVIDATGSVEIHHVTDVHPYWVVGTGWVDAANLKPGMRLATVTGAEATVAGVVDTGQVERTYNFSVADFGTYFVGDSEVLVHNCPRRLAVVAKTPSGRRVEDFTPPQKRSAKAENAAENDGTMRCTDCNRELENVKSEKGVPTPDNQAQVHHDPPLKDGGSKKDSKAIVLCPKCHKLRHSQDQE
jgi:RHS repeat-associated protein